MSCDVGILTFVGRFELVTLGDMCCKKLHQELLLAQGMSLPKWSYHSNEVCG